MSEEHEPVADDPSPADEAVAGASGGRNQRYRRRTVLGALAALATAGAGAPGTASAQSDPTSIVDQLTLAEKVHMVHGHQSNYTGHIAPLWNHDVPGINMLDGPVGVRTEDESPATAFPASIAGAATFDPELMAAQGRAMAREAKSYDVHALLGPALNIHRVPTGGRTFEYYSEDPHLTGEMAAAATSGIQSENVVATPKHYVANSFETNRRTVSANVSERALREIYFPGFRRAVQEGGAGAVMSAYNAVNGENCPQNAHILQEVLKDEWGFDGYVVSDWGAIEDGLASARAGHDLEMWEGKQYGTLDDAVRNGQLAESRLDDMVTRILRSFAETGHLNGSLGSGERNTQAHQDLARRIAEQGATLLKNQNDVLPIDPVTTDSVGVVGPLADQPKVGGGGAAKVQPPYAVDPVSAIQDQFGDQVDVRQGSTDADVVLAFGRVASSEFEDRSSLGLERGDSAIQRAADASAPAVAVLRIPGPVTMPWLAGVDGVLSMWYPGQEDGNATANVLFGDVNPSGKLPTTFGRTFDDYPVSQERRYPGVNGVAHYDEGVFVGYRHFDDAGIDPLFEFGYGQSYTTFGYGSISVPASVEPGGTATVSVDVTNTGDRAGAEAVQFYVEHVDPSVERPPKELAGFDKVQVAPGETTTATVDLGPEAFRYWDSNAGGWTVEEGEYRVHAAASSRDVRSTATITVTTDPGPTPTSTATDTPTPTPTDTPCSAPAAPAWSDGTTPYDVDGDGVYEDFNGNCEFDSDDVVTYFQEIDRAGIQINPTYYDANGNGNADFDDIVTLFQQL